jgi:hypothetical protein
MRKVRGPFYSSAEAQAYVVAVAGQGVPFERFEEYPLDRARRWRSLFGPRPTAIFAVYDDPALDDPDEHIVFDPAQRWVIEQPAV